MTTDITLFTSLRSCFRCGAEFRSHLRERVCAGCRRPKAGPRGLPSRELTVRDRQIIAQIRFGKPNKEIAHELHLSEGTVKEYLNRIFRKVDVTNRTELAVWALLHQVAA